MDNLTGHKRTKLDDHDYMWRIETRLKPCGRQWCYACAPEEDHRQLMTNSVTWEGFSIYDHELLLFEHVRTSFHASQVDL